MAGLMMKYFVLKPSGDDVYAKASRAAMRTYARHMVSVNHDLCNGLREWADRETPPMGEIESGGEKMVGITDGSDKCECHRCIKEKQLTGDELFGTPLSLNACKMILCGECGNKRCPKASDHRNACSGSNEPGQAGSVYA